MRIAWLAAGTIAAFAVQGVADARAASSSLRVVRAAADASVRADRPTSRSGKTSTLRVDGSPAARAYLRFKLSGLSGRVVRAASLWVWLSRPAPWGGLIARDTVAGGWSEQTLSWRNRPAMGLPLGAAVRASGRWVKLDVTPSVRQNGT